MNDSIVTRAIADLDLEMVKAKLVDSDEGEGWNAQLADDIGEEYRKFLALTLAYPDLAIVPSGHVDRFWHQHIIDTQAYAEDCNRVFGRFLHHFPYFGMRGDEDAKNLEDSWENTMQLYVEHFGPPPSAYWSSGSRCPKCGRVEAFAMPRHL